MNIKETIKNYRDFAKSLSNNDDILLYSSEFFCNWCLLKEKKYDKRLIVNLVMDSHKYIGREIRKELQMAITFGNVEFNDYKKYKQWLFLFEAQRLEYDLKNSKK